MVFYCDAAECLSHTAKLRHLEKYPWMREVKWVKWPRNPKVVARWRRLIKRGGKSTDKNVIDKLTITRRSRLCSRHFDKDEIDMWGNAHGDPKYFTWNNWGKPKNPRSLSALQKRNPTATCARTCTATEQPVAVPMDVVDIEDLPQVGQECEVAQAAKVKADVGRMTPLYDCAVETQPADHDYMYVHTAHACCDKGVQTCITMEDISSLESTVKQSQSPRMPGQDVVDCATETDERVTFYTGFHSKAVLQGVYDSISFGVERMKYWRGTESTSEKEYEMRSKKRPGKPHQLSAFFQFIMCLIRLRLDLPVLVLADLFQVSCSTVTRITTTWISFMHQTLVPALLVWPSRENIWGWMPRDFKLDFPNTRVVIDCSEFFIDRPRNKDEQYKTYSQYKSHNTYKVLLGISPAGAFTFVSDLWSGNVSDKYLTEQSGLLEKLDDGDAVMADRGFHIEDVLLKKNVVLIAPPFTRKWHNSKGKRLNVSEIRKTRKIARLRIHVERAIQRLKCWRILKHQIPCSLQNCSSMMVKLVAAFCNLKGPLFHSKPEKHPRKTGASRKRPLKHS